MDTYRQKDNELSFALVIDFLLRYKYPILAVTVLAGIVAAIFSMPAFIPPKYRSTVILYPATTNSISGVLLNTNSSGREDLLAFGEEEQAEQLLQILQSDDITQRIVQKYNLMEHYDIDPEGDYPYTKLTKEFNSNVTYRRTEYMSIEIAVLDEDPQIAADMANDIQALLDSTKNNIQRKRAVEGLQIVKKKYQEKQAFVNDIVDSLRKIGQLGIFNYTEQANVISTQYGEALASGKASRINEIDKQRVLLGKYGPAQKALQDQLEYETEELAQLHVKYEKTLTDAEEMLPATMVVNSAKPAERKYSPVRSLIVLIAMGATFAFSILFFAIWDNYRAYKRDEKARDLA